MVRNANIWKDSLQGLALSEEAGGLIEKYSKWVSLILSLLNSLKLFNKIIPMENSLNDKLLIYIEVNIYLYLI